MLKYFQSCIIENLRHTDAEYPEVSALYTAFITNISSMVTSIQQLAP
jgi:hypothetical protein